MNTKEIMNTRHFSLSCPKMMPVWLKNIATIIHYNTTIPYNTTSSCPMRRAIGSLVVNKIWKYKERPAFEHRCWTLFRSTSDLRSWRQRTFAEMAFAEHSLRSWKKTCDSGMPKKRSNRWTSKSLSLEQRARIQDGRNESHADPIGSKRQWECEFGRPAKR